MDNQLFRQKSLDQIASPEQLHDYLHVTNPALWLVTLSVILLILGFLIWSSLATTDSFAAATASVSDGVMVIRLNNPKMADSVKSGMKVLVGDTSGKITSIGHDPDGSLFAVAEIELADGTYDARVVLRQLDAARLLFN